MDSKKGYQENLDNELFTKYLHQGTNTIYCVCCF